MQKQRDLPGGGRQVTLKSSQEARSFRAGRNGSDLTNMGAILTGVSGIL
jgi:hypothetical protein